MGTTNSQAIKGKLDFPSQVSEISRVESLILDAVDQQGYGDAERFAIKLSIEEALANAIKHGNRSDITKQVHIQYEISDQQACITVQDEGVGFNPENVADPTLDENLEKPSGRGVMLMRVYMDTVTFADQGRHITLTKYKKSS